MARGLRLRHDHGSNYLADDFQQEVAFFGIESSPSFVREPEGNGVAERFIRTLKENLLWVRSFDTIEALRLALLAFKRTYNEQWMLDPFEGGQYERIAFNMIHHGQYHDARQLGNGRARPPYVRRAPGYPLFLATVFALSPEFPSLTHACISDTQCDAAVPVRRRSSPVRRSTIVGRLPEKSMNVFSPARCT